MGLLHIGLALHLKKPKQGQDFYAKYWNSILMSLNTAGFGANSVDTNQKAHSALFAQASLSEILW